MDNTNNRNSNKKFDKDFSLPDTKALSEAYTDYLDSVTFGGKSLSEPKASQPQNAHKIEEQDEEYSKEHNEIVEKIKEKNRILSQSIWTDEPVLKPKKSVWLDDESDSASNVKADVKAKADAPKAEKDQTNAAPKAENSAENDVIIPFSLEKNHIDGAKKEITMEVAADGSLRKKPAKKNFTLKIPDSYYREYDQGYQKAQPVIGGKRVEIIDKRNMSAENSDKADDKPKGKRLSESRVEATINVKLPAENVSSATENVKPAAENVRPIPHSGEGKKSENVKRVSHNDTETLQKSADENSENIEKIETIDQYEEAHKKSLERAAKRRAEREEAKKNNIHELEFNVINAVVCLVIVFGVFIALLVMKRESGFIQSENRNLATFPKFSVSSYFRGEYTSGITEYFTDTVPNRETFKKFCSEFSNMLGIKLNDTVISGDFKTVQKEELDQEKVATTTTVTAFTGSRTTTTSGDTTSDDTTTTKKKTTTEKVVEVPDNLDDGQWEGDVIVSGKGENVRAMGAYYGTFENGDKYAEAINKWKADLGDSVNVYNMSIPTSAAYYMPNNLKDAVSDQKDNIDNIAAGLKGVINTDVYDAIGAHTDEYIYSRTDHHWQPLGAYYAAEVFAGQSGIDFPSLDTYDKWEIDDFVGTMYAYSNYNSELQKYPDKFIYYKPDNNDDLTVTYYDTAFENPVESTLFFDYAEGVNCYSAILNVDQEIAEIDTGVDNDRVLVVFKDSFGNALIPFFTHGFSKIYVCDFRYFDINAIDFCKQVGCTDLLFAISITSCSTPTKVDCLNNIRIQ